MEGHLSNLALFASTPVDAGIGHICYVEYRPLGAITNHSTIEFTIPIMGMEYIDLKKKNYILRLKLLKRIIHL